MNSPSYLLSKLSIESFDKWSRLLTKEDGVRWIENWTVYSRRKEPSLVQLWSMNVTTSANTLQGLIIIAQSNNACSDFKQWGKHITARTYSDNLYVVSLWSPIKSILLQVGAQNYLCLSLTGKYRQRINWPRGCRFYKLSLQ